MVESVKERIARLKAERLQALKELHSTPAVVDEPEPEILPETLSDQIKETQDEHKIEQIKQDEIVLNDEQALAVKWATEGKSFCLAGAAGTGKTTTLKAVVSALISSNSIAPISVGTKYLRAGNPGIVVTAFTKRATKNAAEAISNPSIAYVNFHKLLEYEPVYYEITDEEGKISKTMRFEPSFCESSPLPHINTIIIDESSQFSIIMYDILCAALPAPERTQFIFVGDIQQIPPTMGTSIYGPKLISLPSVELVRVYRQALESPIIRYLTDMRNGEGITRNDWRKYTRKVDAPDERDDRMRMGTFPVNLDWEDALHQATSFLKQEFEQGQYNPYDDMVLVPFNVKFGTIKLNESIAEMLDQKEQRIVHPIITGWEKAYYAIGDHVLFNTEDFVIKNIYPNPKYKGKSPDPASRFIDRTGHPTDRAKYVEEQGINSLDVDIDASQQSSSDINNDININDVTDLVYAHLNIEKNDEDKTNQISHVIVLESLDDPSLPHILITDLGSAKKLSLSYAITVHKAQGLQAKRVYFFFHESHSPMHFRELIYTAASRAKEYLTIICSPKFIEKGIKNQRIPGVTLDEKKEHFIRLFNKETSTSSSNFSRKN